jgi:hypothetical protein
MLGSEMQPMLSQLSEQEISEAAHLSLHYLIIGRSQLCKLTLAIESASTLHVSHTTESGE